MIVFGGENKEIKNMPFLIKTIEEEVNDITFIVALPRIGEKGTGIVDIDNPAVQDLISNCGPIEIDENNLYKIVFEDYVLHQTRNESYTGWDDYEIRKGKHFIMFEKSRLLDYVSQVVSTDIVKFYYPKGYKHYGIYCQNQIIDIIATNEPIIKKVTKKQQ